MMPLSSQLKVVLGVAVLLVLGLVVMVHPRLPNSIRHTVFGIDGGHRRPSCRANMAQLAVALLSYSQDYDERMPPADLWATVTRPYLRRGASVLHCPADDHQPYSYAMNYKLSRVYLGRISDPTATVSLFESNLHRLNAYDKGGHPGDSVAIPPRHAGQDFFAFADGHVKAYDPATVGQDYYRVVRPGGVVRRGLAPPGGDCTRPPPSTP